MFRILFGLSSLETNHKAGSISGFQSIRLWVEAKLVPVGRFQAKTIRIDLLLAKCEHGGRGRGVRVISKRRLREFWEKHPASQASLEEWYKLTRNANWLNLVEVRATFRHADLVGTCTIFNIKGNDYRLITKIDYAYQKVFIKYVLTHSEYDKGRWKNDCGC